MKTHLVAAAWRVLAFPLIIGVGLQLFLENLPAHAKSLSLGFVSTRSTGLSIHNREDGNVPSWHLATYFEKSQFIQVNGDIQYFYVPSFFRLQKSQGAIYSGLGLRVVSYAQNSIYEDYWLRIPFGFQWEVQELNLQAFLEVASMNGPLPETKSRTSQSLGLRIHL